MKKYIILSLIWLSMSVKAQTVTTPQTVNMSKSYLTYNFSSVNFSDSSMTVGNRVDVTVKYKIVSIRPAYNANVKKYFLDVSGDNFQTIDSFRIEISGDKIKKSTQYASNGREDWVLSE